MYTRETPDEYEPPGFQKGCEEDVAWFNDEPISVKPGKVSTPFHNVSVTIRAQASPENIKARVLKRHQGGNLKRGATTQINDTAAKDATANRIQDITHIDVGPSDGNSARITKDIVVRDTQDEMDTDDSPHQERSPYILAGTETSCTKTRDSHPMSFSNNNQQNVPSRLRKRRKISKAELIRK